MTETAETAETADINLVTYLIAVKKVESTGHHHVGRQLRVHFNLTEEELQKYRMEYINSQFALYDATKKNLLQLLK